MAYSDTKFRTYLYAFFGDWLTGMSGPLSVPFAAAAVWSSSRVQQALWGCLAVFAAVFSSYRVWSKERNAGRLQLDSLREAKDREITVLNERIAVLNRKPYPEDLEHTARQVLQNQMTLEGRHVLRYLMFHGPVEVGRMDFPEIPQERQYAQIGIAMQNGLVRHMEERQGALVRTSWIISPQFQPVLESVLYERGMLD